MSVVLSFPEILLSSARSCKYGVPSENQVINDELLAELTNHDNTQGAETFN